LFNAFLHPAMERFLYGAEHRLKRYRTRNPLLIFRNDGGSARVAKTIALKTYSSGPRGGMEGAREIARHYGFDSLLSIDIGGTSTDVGVIETGEVQHGHHGVVEGVPVSVPLCHIHSEGVGGSSIIRIVDGVIRVGPESVGAAPGPACFGRGGTELTMTDVALLNGMIDPATYFGGELALDRARAETALAQAVGQPLNISTDDALATAEAAWTSKIVTGVEHLTGINDDTMLAGFGGGGPMLLTAIAEALGLEQAIIPGMAPVFSAYGIGFSDLSQHYQVHVNSAGAAALTNARAELLQRARRDMFAEGTAIEDCRLDWSLVRLGADDEVMNWAVDAPPPTGLEAPLLLRLEACKPIERLTLKSEEDATAYAASTASTRRILYRKQSVDVPLYRFQDLEAAATGEGPCIVEDDFFTARIDAGWRFRLSGNRDLLLTRGSVQH
jgi:N-methylhydantoinase A/oxoprolinase/acetone carboxylase beta subunit